MPSCKISSHTQDNVSKESKLGLKITLGCFKTQNYAPREGLGYIHIIGKLLQRFGWICGVRLGEFYKQKHMWQCIL